MPRHLGVAGLAVLMLARPAVAFELEMNTVVLKNTLADPTWTSVAYAQAFSVRPVVVALPTSDGSDPATIRVRNVTTTGFEIAQVEPNANDGPHVGMTTAYLAVEPGNHILPDGSRMIVLEHSTTSVVGRFVPSTWDIVNFPSSFNSAPAVIAGIQTVLNEQQSPPMTSSIPFMDVALRNINSNRVQVSLERAETTAGSVVFAERIGIIAIERTVNFTFTDAFASTVRLQSLQTPRNIRGFSDGCFTNNYTSAFAGTPLAVASQNSRAGNNGGWLRRCSQSASAIGLTVDEDIDNDLERSHTPEEASVIAASVAFHVNFAVDLLVSKSVSVVADPINGSTNPYSIPNADMQYVVAVANQGAISPDSGTVIITDEISNELRLCVTAACLPGGPVVLDTSGSPVPPGVSLGGVAYSNNGGASFAYVPIPDGDGFDATVDAIQVTMAGQLASMDPLGAPSFDLILAARVN